MKHPFFSRLIFVVLLPIFLATCDHPDRQFKELAQELNTLESQELNDFSRDSLLDTAWEQAQILKQDLALFIQKINPQTSDLPYYQLEQDLEDLLDQIDQLRSDPSLYNLGGHLKVAIAQPQQTLEQKILVADSLLGLAPNYYKAAKRKLTHPQAERLNLAVRKQALGIYFLNGAFQDSLAVAGLDTQVIWREKSKATERAMKDFIAWCNSQLIDYHAIENSLSDE